MMRCFFLSDLPARFPDRKEIPLQSDLPTQSCHLFHSTLLNKTGLKATENFFRTDSDLPARFPDRKEIPLQSDLPTQSCHLFHSTLLNKTGLKATENFFRTD